MKSGPVTILEKGNTATSQKIDDNVMLGNCNVIAIFLIYGQFGANRKLDSGRMFKNYIFNKSKLLS